MKRNVSVRKVSNFAIVINTIQILLVMGIALYAFFAPHALTDVTLVRYAILLAALLASWGAYVDIREAWNARRVLGQVEDMETSLQATEELNNSLRAQRHDFLNHLQVVYSLMEMKEYKEANAYIERVYGDITSLSRVMKTASASVNALLQVKLAACEKAHIKVLLQIQSPWKDLPVPGWEMCKVLSNLIDNAIDALQDQSQGRQLILTLTEDLKTFRFAVENNGPAIPPKTAGAIFQAGFSTKGQGHGMGLFIARKTLREYGGDLRVSSDRERTVFAGYVPKEKKEE